MNVVPLSQYEAKYRRVKRYLVKADFLAVSLVSDQPWDKDFMHVVLNGKLITSKFSETSTSGMTHCGVETNTRTSDWC